MNDNWEGEPYVPIGPDNNIQPGGPDQGSADAFSAAPQPLHVSDSRAEGFRRERNGLDVDDAGQAAEGVWLAAAGSRVIENIDIMSETGALGAGSSSPELRADKPPVVKIDGAQDAVRQSRSAALADHCDHRRRYPAVAAGQGGANPGGRGRNPAMFPPDRPRSARTSVCTCLGTSIVAAATSRSSPTKSKPGKTPGTGQTPHGHPSGLRPHSRPTGNRPCR